MKDPTSDDAIIDLERSALERWCHGDPSGFLELSAPDVSYFDPFLERRLDGLDALRTYYEGLRGKINAVNHELIEPRVQHLGDAALLTFHFSSWGAAGDAYRWHCTEAYRRGEEGWRIVHTHWCLLRGSST